MLNCEKYREEIEKAEYRIAIIDGEIKNCDSLQNCEGCSFLKDINPSCGNHVIKWLMSEYVEKPKISQRQHDLCKALKEYGFNWIARDGDTHLYACRDEPIKANRLWRSDDYYKISNFDDIDHFDFIKWEDEEPWAIDDILKLEVE